MLIDWFTVAAQVINFLILVWLLKRYLYQPILNAIDAREQRIEEALADAAFKQDQAKVERDIFNDKNEKFDQERDHLLQQARDSVESEHQRLLTKMQVSVEALRVKQQKSMANDARNLKQSLSRQLTEEVFTVTRKTLNDLATVSLEQQMTTIFIKRLNDLDDASNKVIAKALAITSLAEPALLISAFKLTKKQRNEIEKALKQILSVDVVLQFSQCEDLISGIELRANGQKLVWSITDYLSSLEERIETLLQENISPALTEPTKKQTSKVNSNSKAKPIPAPISKIETNTKEKSKKKTDTSATKVEKP